MNRQEESEFTQNIKEFSERWHLGLQASLELSSLCVRGGLIFSNAHARRATEIIAAAPPPPLMMVRQDKPEISKLIRAQVVLRGGGPLMYVVGYGNGLLICQWAGPDNQVIKHSFYPEMLEFVAAVSAP